MQTSDSQPEGSGPAMTQQEQQEFTARLQEADAWMKGIEEQLKANDNTAGPRDALEARLRETEKIHHSSHNGQMIVDQALLAAEKLLQSGDEELRNSTNEKLKELKNQWDETSTYIVHCHSRIEWVWLHWSEYLKAYEEFELWLTKQRRSLDLDVELQMGLKEKLWQVEQQMVIVSDIKSQAVLLERLLDEAAALHSRIEDPSVDAKAQQRLQEDYMDVRDRAQERLMLLQKISEEHHMFHSHVQKFQSWLVSKTKELTELMKLDEPPESKLRALKTLDESMATEEKTLLHIEGVADAVRTNTSPAGAEAVQEEAEELRLGWQRLRQGLCEAEEGLHCSLDSHSQYVTRCQRLGEDIGRIREMLQDLDQELVDTQESKSCTETTEEQMEGQWRKYSVVRNTLAGKESQVELLKSQLKDLFRFSEDPRHLTDGVLAVVKEHQSVKSRASRLCSESELELRSLLRDPLLNFFQWANSVSQVMEASNNVNDFSNTAMLLQKIQGLLQNSAELQERLSLLQVKGDLLDSVFGTESSDDLQGELSAAVRTRELLHNQLLERKNRLESLISRTKDFDEAYKQILASLSTFRERLLAADALQPDILAKKSQLEQMLVLQKELEDSKAQLTVLETLVSSNQSSRTQYEKLCADWSELHRRVTVKVRDCDDIVSDHECFHGDLLNMEKWIMVMRQKLDSFCSPTGGWSVEGRRPEAQKLLGEFPEKEVHLQQIEAQGGKVLRRTSTDGQVHIRKDMERLRQRWNDLFTLSLNLNRMQGGSTEIHSGSAESFGRLGSEPGSVTHVVDPPGFCQTDGPKRRVTGGREGNEATTSSSGEDDSRGRRGLNQINWSEFEAWLSRENEVLMKITRTSKSSLSAKEIQTRRGNLQALISRLPEGQQMFQLLLQQTQSRQGEDESLEDLRYRWTLYKSKLKEVENSLIMTKPGLKERKELELMRGAEDVKGTISERRTGKKCGLLYRICRLALLLWLLFLALLLLAFLLPLMDDGNSCSLSNNFARSFNLMLRYDGPPPT
ncbi:nesprin-3 isoform X1 [Poecilia reticulata]|uniref:nesprin-3 isoform X1 n=2 Tax=Poecilia reticulata TaxID=8081 RepID=UPI0004A28E21|nr:PREDICTED: nesprin-3 isoform X1 [Poecilia reticulata]XP_017157987.1 PREDICTED: nesprin-3 isoform X1 [Poecilia reticulata]